MRTTRITIKYNKGFTLIELMITVVVIGIIMALALPSYQDYVIRSQISEAISLTKGAKSSSIEHYTYFRTFPNNNTTARYQGANGNYTSSVNINGASITANLGNLAHTSIQGKNIVMTGVVDPTGTILWTCTSSTKPKYLPKNCTGIP